MCFNWNALVAAAETTNKLSIQMKTALFTNLQYFLPLVEGSVCVLVPSKARNRPPRSNLLNMHMQRPLYCACAVAVNLLGAAKAG